MNEFILRLRAAWNYLRYVPFTSEADHEDFWTKEDAKTHEQYWNSPTGQKLKLRAQNFINRSAVRANHAASDIQHASGWACGVAATFHWLDEHLPEPEQSTLSEDEQNDPLLHLRP